MSDCDTIVEMRAAQKRAYDHMERIRDAMKDAGHNPEMLDQLPPTYLTAALILGVKE